MDMFSIALVHARRLLFRLPQVKKLTPQQLSQHRTLKHGDLASRSSRLRREAPFLLA
ncbi:hypothetical protein PAXINDRAFT_169459 [Paxillus involutus ATCC 200175]|uniref:Uncharacterized protein n=1 Tax=Paxillus involutus ATCC 200175 TaxID=664439 RepID=A0A0C9U5S1_PAXIN|nr:hypothetical protein PAXINDRAFT_169459 [Paxillus involutus ATCC 200175]